MTLVKSLKFKIGALSVIAALTLGVSVYAYAQAFSEVRDLNEVQKTTENQTKTPESAKKSQESADLEENTSPEPAYSPATATQPTKQTATQQTAPQPVKTEPLDGGHVPFTSKPVTPGDPSSYVDTVGQCPFYEMAGEKGCVPPPDVECNADWSVCTYVGDKW